MEKIKETKRKLIRENTEVVNAMRQNARLNAARLNSAYQFTPFKSREELVRAIADIPRFNTVEQRKDKFTANLLDRGQSVPLSQELVRRQDALQGAQDSFQFTRHSGEGWEEDTDAIETMADLKHRRYITEEWEFVRLEQVQRLVEALNAIPMGDNARRRNWLFMNDSYANELVKYDNKSRQWVVNLDQLFKNENQFQN